MIRNGQKAMGRDVTNGSMLAKAKHGMNILSILVTWALENAIETSDSMRQQRIWAAWTHCLFNLSDYTRRESGRLGGCVGRTCQRYLLLDAPKWGGLTRCMIRGSSTGGYLSCFTGPGCSRYQCLGSLQSSRISAFAVFSASFRYFWSSVQSWKLQSEQETDRYRDRHDLPPDLRRTGRSGSYVQ